MSLATSLLFSSFGLFFAIFDSNLTRGDDDVPFIHGFALEIMTAYRILSFKSFDNYIK